MLGAWRVVVAVLDGVGQVTMRHQMQQVLRSINCTRHKQVYENQGDICAGPLHLAFFYDNTIPLVKLINEIYFM